MSKLETRVIQVTNVAPSTSKEQLKTLFGFLGRIRDCKVFPPDGSDQQVTAKVCYVEFEDATSAGVSLHLTNTVFIDRALIVVPVMDGKIPDERVAMQLTPQHVSRMAPGQPAWPANVVSQLSGIGINQVITTYDPRLNALGLPQYPPLPASLDAAHVEEIRRTVYVSNLDPKTPPDSLIAFFSQVGEVKYVRMAGEDTLSSRSAFIEFTDQRSVATCLTYNGVVFSGRSLTITHARSNIVKPLSKSQEASRREVEEAMKKVKEAQSLISAAAGACVDNVLEKSRSRSRSRRKSHSRSRAGSRSRSRSRRRSRSRSKGRRRRSRSRGRRSRSPRRIRRSKSRSPHRRGSRSRRSKSKERRRSRSKSKPRHRTRSRSRSRRRSRTPPRAYSSRRSHSRSRGRKSRSKSRPRSRSRDKDGIRAKDRSKDKDKSRDKERDRSKDTDKDKDIEKKKEPEEKKKSGSRSPSPPTLEREGSAVLHSDDEGSPAKLELRERSKSPVPIRSSRRRSISRSPVRIQRRRSGSRGSVRTSRRRSITPKKIRRSKSRSPRRSRSPLKKKKPRSRSRSRRSRSGSHHRPKKDKKKEKERSRSRERKEKEKERERERKKKSSRDKKDDKEKPSKVVRDYDEEEKGYNSGSDPETQSRAEVDEEDDIDEKSNEDHRLEDMEMSD